MSRSLLPVPANSGISLIRPSAIRGGLCAIIAIMGWLLVERPIALAQSVPAALPDLRLVSGGTVTAMAVQHDGKIIIAGTFTLVNEVPRASLARLNTDGSLDLNWNPYVVLSGQNQPLSVILEVGGYIYIGGGNFLVNNLQSDLREMARIGTSDGTVDQAWNPSVTGGVVRVIVNVGSQLYIGGTFTSLGILPRNGLARLNLDGTPDGAWNPAPNGEVSSIAVGADYIFVGGSFSNIGGQARTGLAKLSTSTGLADASWNPQLTGGTGSIRALALSDTHLFVAGNFSAINNINRDGLARISTEGNGAVDINWNPFINNGNGMTPFTVLSLAIWSNSVFLGGNQNQQSFLPLLAKASVEGIGAVDSAWAAQANVADGANVNGSVNTLVVTPGGLLVGGTFVHLGVSGAGGTPSLGLGKLNVLSGQLEGSFRGQAQIPGAAYAIARQLDGRVLVGGAFQSAGGLARANLVRISSSGEVDRTWAPNTDGPVYTLAVSRNDLFAGGIFTRAGGIARTNLAKLRTIGLDSADANWEANIGTPYAPVRALLASGTNLFVGGGEFYGWGSIGGQSRTALAKLSIANPCVVDTNWVVDAPAGGVRALALSGTNLFVGGGFPSIGGITRTGLALVSAVGTGAVDTTWSPAIPNFTAQVNALALSETNLFVGGLFKSSSGIGRNKLAKLSATGTGQLDTLWAPDVSAGDYEGIESLAVSGTNVFVAGTFSSIAGKNISSVARLSGSGTGLVSVAFAPNPSGNSHSLLVSGNDVYVGGSFGTFGDDQKVGFAFQPVADAPVLIQETATNLFIFRNALDGAEVTHFRILSTGSQPLYLSDGKTLVQGGDFITVGQGAAGLVFVPNGGITAVSAINSTTQGCGTASSFLSMAATAPPVFAFSSGNYSVREGQGSVVITVRKFGSGPASVSYTTVDLTATAGVDYVAKSGVLNFLSTEKFKNIVVTIADDLLAEGDEQFSIRLFSDQNANQLGTVASPALAVVTIVDNDIIGLADSFTTNALPASQPLSTGALRITLSPTNANGQWRLLGEFNWHNSGDLIRGLSTNNYDIEFRPVAGYKEPETATRAIAVDATNEFSFAYSSNSTPTIGKLKVLIGPSNVATNLTDIDRGQWHLSGETNWHDSVEVISNLTLGMHTVEFKSVAGYVTPAARSVAVFGGVIDSITVNYLFASPNGAATNMLVVAPGMAISNRPYCFVGQIETSAGFGSGFVVKPRVVLTAGHVLFEDQLLANVTEVRWFFQRYRGLFEPAPQTPRGWYLFEGYAAQRREDNSPGVSSPASQQLDAAAMFFLEPAGRGGFGGYLSSDADDNEYLLNATDKFLAGYPLDGVPEPDQGKLFASTPTNLTFVRLPGTANVFRSTDLVSFPGNSGGPLYVQTDIDTFYPAAIYLGDSSETHVRAINSEVVDLINRAEISSNGGGNSTGGGVTILRIGVTAQSAGYATIQVELTLTNATHVLPGWRLQSTVASAYYTDPVTSVSVYADPVYPYILEFKTIPGFLTPGNFTLTNITQDQVAILEVNYVPIPPVLAFNANGLRLTGATGAVYRVEFATNLAPTIWNTLSNVTLTASPLTLSDTAPQPNGDRFYRAALVP